MSIHPGDKGDKVVAVQSALIAHGFSLADGADGDFGPGTEKAVRAFQQQQGLTVDGKAGKDTLQALGLDPDTLQPLAGDGAATDTDAKVVTFTQGDVTVPPPVEQHIRDFAAKAIDTRSKVLMSTLNALAQFETTTSHASAAEANPDVLGALVSTAISKAVDKMIEHVPLLSEIKPYYDAVTTELERAGKAKESLEVGDWIKDQRAVIDGKMQKVSLDDMVSTLEEGYLDLDQAGRETRFQELSDAVGGMDDLPLPNIDELECEFYEQWINAHYNPSSDNHQGYIKIRYKFDTGTFDFVSCEVNAPSGDKLESALNRLFDRGQVPGISKPLDLRVRKYAEFYVEDLVPGGQDWSGGWLDADNAVTDTPSLPEASKAFDAPDWRATPRFKRD